MPVNIGNNIALVSATDVADAAGNRVLVADSHRDVSNELYSIDLVSGLRTLITDATCATARETRTLTAAACPEMNRSR